MIRWLSEADWPVASQYVEHILQVVAGVLTWMVSRCFWRRSKVDSISKTLLQTIFCSESLNQKSSIERSSHGFQQSSTSVRLNFTRRPSKELRRANDLALQPRATELKGLVQAEMADVEGDLRLDLKEKACMLCFVIDIYIYITIYLVI